MVRDLTRSLLAMALATVVLGLLYPAGVRGVTWIAFRDTADGSLIERDGRVIGSSLLGQPFAAAGSFAGRPSAGDHEADASGGSNLGPNSRELATVLAARVAAVASANGVSPRDVPVDLVTASGSGLDPHISPTAAEIQVPRVARIRGLDEGSVRTLVAAHTQGRTLGFIGQERVNVLELNLALDAVAR